MEELLARHRKEKRDLQSRITQKKKNATKKTRKGVNDECERLEHELAGRQEAEIAALTGNGNDTTDGLEASVDALAIDEDPVDGNSETVPQERNETPPSSHSIAPSPSPSSDQQSRPKKPNRQKARLARRAAEQEAQAAAAALEAENQPDLREQEMASMKKQMESLGLSETLIRPDGHCLFSACAHSMPADLVSKPGLTNEPYQNVRIAAAEFMASHPDDFGPFLEEPLETYVKKIRDTAEWGGQLELQAIARSYNIDINVLQADGRVEKISSAENKDPEEAIWLAYYRHSFGLGEHYNALRKVNVDKKNSNS
ncbi:OTU domain-containing protein 2 [Exophiala dermatitidis]